MKNGWLALPVATVLLIQGFVLSQAPEVSLAAYETLMHIRHIVETGLPLTEMNALAGGSLTTVQPLFYYLLAFFSLFMPEQLVLLIIPNLLLASVPVIMYLLSTQMTRDKRIQVILTVSSVFIPTLYQGARDASPMMLAIPLILLSYYFFLRVGSTPKDQVRFIIVIIAAMLTHPIALILPVAMALTLLITQVQKTRFSHAQIEATIFTIFFGVWAMIVVFREAVQLHGISVLWIGGTTNTVTLPGIAAQLGIIPLIAGILGAYLFLTDERNANAHAIFALAVTVTLAAAFNILSLKAVLTLLGATLILLASGALELFKDERKKSRAPAVYTLVAVIAALLFVATSAMPAVALGIQSIGDIPNNQEQEILESIPPQSTVLWIPEYTYYLIAAGHNSALGYHEWQVPDYTQRQELLNASPSEIRYIQLLSDYDVNIVVGNITYSERCFRPLHAEVYQLRCVVQ